MARKRKRKPEPYYQPFHSMNKLARQHIKAVSSPAVCPRCQGRIFQEAEGRYCLNCGFTEPITVLLPSCGRNSRLRPVPQGACRVGVVGRRTLMLKGGK